MNLSGVSLVESRLISEYQYSEGQLDPSLLASLQRVELLQERCGTTGEDVFRTNSLRLALSQNTQTPPTNNKAHHQLSFILFFLFTIFFPHAFLIQLFSLSSELCFCFAFLGTK